MVSNHGSKGFNMIYHSNLSDDFCGTDFAWKTISKN